MPNSRTLRDYNVFSTPKSGWQYDTLKEMRSQFEQKRKDNRNGPHSELGGLFFDECKSRKVFLVFAPYSEKLIGFVDYEADDGDLDEDGRPVSHLLATNVMQFYYKSLFSTFSCPCANFFTRSVNATQINTMFWSGVQALHEHGFDVLLACADGASYNRTFFKMNATEAPWKSENPWLDVKKHGHHD